MYGTAAGRCTIRAMAHAKDKGASKNVKKKAAKGIKEKRALKKLKHEGRRTSGSMDSLRTE